MKRISKNTLILFFLVLTFIGCSEKEDFTTSGELIGKELKQVIKEYGVNRVECRDINQNVLTGIDGVTDFEIKGETIRVGIYWYNLSYLARYSVTGSENDILLQRSKLVLLFNFPG